MGNKCEFCRTEFGGSHHVGFRLMGASDCGKCSGVLNSKKECAELGDYYKRYIEFYKTAIDNARKNLEEYEQKLDKVRDIYRANKFTEE